MNAGSPEEVERLLDDTLPLFETDPRPFTQLISMLGKANKPDLASSVFHRLGRTPPPNIFTFGAIIKAWADQGNEDKVEHYLHEMQTTHGIAPDVFTFNALINMHRKRKKEEEGEGEG